TFCRYSLPQRRFAFVNKGEFMLLENIDRKVVRLMVDEEIVYIQPQGLDRLLMLWTFRHFPRISQAALRMSEQARIWRLYRSGRRVHIGGFYVWSVMVTVQPMYTPSPQPHHDHRTAGLG